MGMVKAGPDEFLVIGRNGKLVNAGMAVQRYLWPGTVHVLVPCSRQETCFELTQESSDGIPLRFKGIILYRIVDPIEAAHNFNFSDGDGIAQIGTLINHIALGELRAVVAHMTMQQCIEQRKTTLSLAVETALRKITAVNGGNSPWGIQLEVIQVAQVFIVDESLRKQLEAELRNQVWVKSEQSNLQTREELQQAQLLSGRRINDSKMADEKEAIRRKEEIELSEMNSRRRIQDAQLEAEREEQARSVERVRSQQEAEQARLDIETPVRLARLKHQEDCLRAEEQTRQLENRVQELVVHKEMLLEIARQNLKKEILPLEQAPALAEAAAKTLNGAKLTYLGADPHIFELIGPLLMKAAGNLNNFAEKNSQE